MNEIYKYNTFNQKNKNPKFTFIFTMTRNIFPKQNIHGSAVKESECLRVIAKYSFTKAEDILTVASSQNAIYFEFHSSFSIRFT